MIDLTGPARGYLRDGVAEDLAQLAEAALAAGELSGATFSTAADGSSGVTAELIAKWEAKPQPAMVFTGYIPPGSPADRLVKSGRAKFLRWNVHPRLTDTIAMAKATGAATLIPAFCDRQAPARRCRPRSSRRP